jgi:ABC-type transport system involved in multi-copper enzyme maturation permease subunit
MEEKMLKLSIKDIRIYWLTFLINFVFWTVMAPAAIQSPDVYMMLPIGFGLLIIIIPLGNDVRDGRDILYASLPIKRSKIVMARYLSSFVLAAAAFAWLIILGLLIERYMPVFGGNISGILSFESLIMLFLLITLIICIYLPFVLRFGFIAVISGGLAITATIMAGFWWGSSYLISRNAGALGIEAGRYDNLLNSLSGLDLLQNLTKIMGYYGRGVSITVIILVMIIAIIISILISLKIFKEKEL